MAQNQHGSPKVAKRRPLQKQFRVDRPLTQPLHDCHCGIRQHSPADSGPPLHFCRVGAKRNQQHYGHRYRLRNTSHLASLIPRLYCIELSTSLGQLRKRNNIQHERSHKFYDPESELPHLHSGLHRCLFQFYVRQSFQLGALSNPRHPWIRTSRLPAADSGHNQHPLAVALRLQDQRASGLGHLWSHLFWHRHPLFHLLQLRRNQLPILLVLLLPPLLRHLLQRIRISYWPQLIQQILLKTADVLLRRWQRHELIRPQAGNVHNQQSLCLDKHLPRHAGFNQSHLCRYRLLPHQNNRLGQCHLKLPPGYLRRRRSSPHLRRQP